MNYAVYVDPTDIIKEEHSVAPANVDVKVCFPMVVILRHHLFTGTLGGRLCGCGKLESGACLSALEHSIANRFHWSLLTQDIPNAAEPVTDATMRSSTLHPVDVRHGVVLLWPCVAYYLSFR